MECSCNIDLYDSEPLKFWSLVIRKANKEHKCIECGEVIPKGAYYERYSSLSYDGIWCTDKTCRTCARIRDSYFKNGFIIGSLRETLRECLGLDYVTGETDDEEATTEPVA